MTTFETCEIPVGKSSELTLTHHFLFLTSPNRSSVSPTNFKTRHYKCNRRSSPKHPSCPSVASPSPSTASRPSLFAPSPAYPLAEPTRHRLHPAICLPMRRKPARRRFRARTRSRTLLRRKARPATTTLLSSPILKLRWIGRLDLGMSREA